MGNTFNKVSGVFRLGQDPDLKYTAAGVAIATISGASEYSYKKKGADEWTKETEWTRMVAFAKQAETIGEYLRKGSLIYAEGRLKTNKWDDKDGVTRYSTDVVLNFVKFLADFGNDDRAEKPADKPAAGPKDYEDSDIPF